MSLTLPYFFESKEMEESLVEVEKKHSPCNNPKYTIVVFDMFRVFCKCNLNVS